MKYYTIFLIILSTRSVDLFVAPAKTVYIIPFPGFEKNNLLFDATQRDDCLAPFVALKDALIKRGYCVQLTRLEQPLKNPEIILIFDIPENDILQKLKTYKTIPQILMLWEPPTVSARNYDRSLHTQFPIILTMLDDFIDNKKYYKFYYPQPSLEPQTQKIYFEEKKFCTLIACNKQSRGRHELYSQRRDIIAFFESNAPRDFDLYGIGWGALGLKTYSGPIERKKTILQQYKFCICYENTQKLNGYITEKIFDCFVAGCLPVYWGANNISRYIPSDCFIDRRIFRSNEDLYQWLKNMPQEAYEGYRDRIDRFLCSSQAHYFSISYFISTILHHVDKNYDKKEPFMQENIG